MDKVTLKIKKLVPGAKLPVYGSENAAGADLYALSDHDIRIGTRETAVVHTGLAAEIPQGYVGLIFARSGLATKRVCLPQTRWASSTATTAARSAWRCTTIPSTSRRSSRMKGWRSWSSCRTPLRSSWKRRSFRRPGGAREDSARRAANNLFAAQRVKFCAVRGKK